MLVCRPWRNRKDASSTGTITQVRITGYVAHFRADAEEREIRIWPGIFIDARWYYNALGLHRCGVAVARTSYLTLCSRTSRESGSCYVLLLVLNWISIKIYMHGYVYANYRKPYCQILVIFLIGSRFSKILYSKCNTYLILICKKFSSKHKLVKLFSCNVLWFVYWKFEKTCLFEVFHIFERVFFRQYLNVKHNYGCLWTLPYNVS